MRGDGWREGSRGREGWEWVGGIMGGREGSLGRKGRRVGEGDNVMGRGISR